MGKLEKGRQAMEEATQIDHGPKVSVTVPEKYFCRWLEVGLETTRLEIRHDFRIEILASIIVVFTLLLTVAFCPAALIVVAPTILNWIRRNRRKSLS